LEALGGGLKADLWAGMQRDGSRRQNPAGAVNSRAAVLNDAFPLPDSTEIAASQGMIDLEMATERHKKTADLERSAVWGFKD